MASQLQLQPPTLSAIDDTTMYIMNYILIDYYTAQYSYNSANLLVIFKKILLTLYTSLYHPENKYEEKTCVTCDIKEIINKLAITNKSQTHGTNYEKVLGSYDHRFCVYNAFVYMHYFQYPGGKKIGTDVIEYLVNKISVAKFRQHFDNNIDSILPDLRTYLLKSTPKPKKEQNTIPFMVTKLSDTIKLHNDNAICMIPVFYVLLYISLRESSIVKVNIKGTKPGHIVFDINIVEACFKLLPPQGITELDYIFRAIINRPYVDYRIAIDNIFSDNRQKNALILLPYVLTVSDIFSIAANVFVNDLGGNVKFTIGIQYDSDKWDNFMSWGKMTNKLICLLYNATANSMILADIMEKIKIRYYSDKITKYLVIKDGGYEAIEKLINLLTLNKNSFIQITDAAFLQRPNCLYLAKDGEIMTVIGQTSTSKNKFVFYDQENQMYYNISANSLATPLKKNEVDNVGDVGDASDVGDVGDVDNAGVEFVVERGSDDDNDGEFKSDLVYLSDEPVMPPFD